MFSLGGMLMKMFSKSGDYFHEVKEIYRFNCDPLDVTLTPANRAIR